MYKKIIVALTVGAMLVGPAVALADTSTIDAQSIGQLHKGSKGDSVKFLQALLAADPSIYPEGLITGTYGNLTAKAVAKFQKKHGLEQVGNVGPKTLKKLESEIASTSLAVETDDHGKKQACAMVPPGHLVAPGWLKKHGGVAPVVPTCQTLPPGIANKLGTTTPPTGTTTPDTTAPVISSIAVTNLGNTGATIGWLTNEGATTQVEYGTTTAYGSTSTLSTPLITSHSVALSGLATSTVYHFRVLSRDASNNFATSGDMTLTTLADATAPVITNITFSNLASTSITINWLTNEAATGKVYFGTTSPINLSTAATIADLALTGSHSMNITSLATSTTYYYVIESKDAANNTATTTQGSFATLAF